MRRHAAVLTRPGPGRDRAAAEGAEGVLRPAHRRLPALCLCQGMAQG